MTGTVSLRRYLRPVKLFIVGMSRKFDAQWIRAIEVVLEPTSPPSSQKESSSQGMIEVVRINRYTASNDLLAPHVVLCANGGVRPQTLFKVQVFNNVIK